MSPDGSGGPTGYGPGASVPGDSAQGRAASITPAPATNDIVDGLAVVRRRRDDVDPALPTVLLVHGAMDRAASFGRVVRRLPDLDVIAFDRRGYGASLDAGVAENLAAHVDDLEQVIEWSGAEHVVVVGHSLGGTITLSLGARGTTPVVGLGAFEAPMPSLDGSWASIGGGSVAIGEREGPAEAAEFFYRMMIGDDTWDRLRTRDRVARRSEGPALMAELSDLRRPVTTVELDRVKVPVVMGAGELSRADLRDMATRLRDALPDAWMIEIAGAGHGAHLSHADEFARYVRACVARAQFAMEGSTHG